MLNNYLGSGCREGHFGLNGMRERAELVVGKLAVWSDIGAGTDVLPALKAYTKSPHRFGLVQKFSVKEKIES